MSDTNKLDIQPAVAKCFIQKRQHYVTQDALTMFVVAGEEATGRAATVRLQSLRHWWNTSI